MKRKNILRKIIYLLLFLALGVCFIVISEKYKDNSVREKIVITDYYDNLNDDLYDVIGGIRMIKLLQEGKNMIVIGSKNSDWSKAYVTELDMAFKELDIKNVYHYDINNDKAQKNSNYYEIKELLVGSLTTTDGSNSNLLAPSFYIIDNGKVLYYNTDTVAMKNTIKPSDYWTEEKKSDFNIEITSAIKKYYLNNK